MSDFTITSTPLNAGMSGTGRTPVNRVLLDNQVLDVRARSMMMQRSPNQHDAVSLALSSPTLEDTEGIANRPISFVYGLPPRVENWYGYVTKVTEEQRDNVNLNFTLTLLGVTMLMQLGKPRFWTNKTIPSVVRDLTNSNLVGFIGSEHPYAWKTLTQTAESDWQVMVRITGRIGFGLFNWNGVVLCEDPLVLYNSNGSYARLVPESDLDIGDRQLLEFTPVQDAERTYTGYGVKLAYLTSDGRVGWSLQPKYERHKFMGFPIRSQAEADVYIAAIAKRSEGWLQGAKARIKGDSSIYPGLNVDVVTTASNTKDKKFDGKWLVIGVSHKMDNQSFQTELALARPDSTTPSQVLPFRPFWEGSGLGKPTVFIHGEGGDRRWASSWADARLRSIL